MCMFSPTPLGVLGRLVARGRRETHVADTRIFAHVDGATQWLAYQMRVTTSSDVAMILPVPVVPGQGEDALAFVDLSEYPSFFDDLARLFPTPELLFGQPKGGFQVSRHRQTLVVHSVGSFDASYVPSRADFVRLDPRFRIPDRIWDALPAYADWGFAVFALKKGRDTKVHPMAFRFPTRFPSRVFFPTVHVHDGALHPTAAFEHALYYQAPSAARGDRWSEATAGACVDAARARGLVDPASHVGLRALVGSLPNEDTWVDLEAGARVASSSA